MWWSAVTVNLLRIIGQTSRQRTIKRTSSDTNNSNANFARTAVVPHQCYSDRNVAHRALWARQPNSKQRAAKPITEKSGTLVNKSKRRSMSVKAADIIESVDTGTPAFIDYHCGISLELAACSLSEIIAARAAR